MRLILFSLLLFLTSCFQQEPKLEPYEPDLPVEAPTGNEEEIKEILRLTRILSHVEANISKVHREYGAVQSMNLETQEMGSDKDKQLLSDIDAIFNKLDEDQETIDNLRRQLKAYKSSNADVNRIKQYFENIVTEKDQQIEDLSSKLHTLQTSLLEKEKVINSQTETIVKQINHIESQKQKIDELSQKYLILYARRETSMQVIYDNTIKIPQRLRRIEIVSYHEDESYVITEKDGESIIVILDEDKFWDFNNYIIVRVRSRSL